MHVCLLREAQTPGKQEPALCIHSMYQGIWCAVTGLEIIGPKARVPVSQCSHLETQLHLLVAAVVFVFS